MKLAAKLLLSLAGLALVAIAVMGWVEHRRRAELLALDIDQDQRVGHVLQESISALCGDAGVDVCQRLVESINEAAPLRDIQWLWLRDISDPDLQRDIEAVNLNDPDPGRRVVWRIRTQANGLTSSLILRRSPRNKPREGRLQHACDMASQPVGNKGPRGR